MHPSGKLPEPVNPPILNLGCRLDTIFANFKHIILLVCTQVPEGYFRAMFFRLLQGVQQIGSRIETKGRKKKKLLLVEFIWLAKYCILS